MRIRQRNLRVLRLLGFIFVAGVSCLVLIRWYEYSSSDVAPLSDNYRFLERVSTLASGASNPKLILVWTTIFGNPFPQAAIQECTFPPEKRCIGSSDRSRLAEAAAVVFHISSGDLRLSDLPPLRDRRPDQLYAFMTMEAPPNHNRKLIASLPTHFFNITMTYRYDSDVPFPYGGYWVEPSIAKRLGFPPENLQYDEETILSNKSKLIFWLVSNCVTDSRREIAVEKLKKYIQIDIFGKCATNEVDRKKCKRDENCERELAEQYYFFIAAENSICKDYVSEKYWSRYTWPAVPIFLRRHIYERLLPPDSFIAMDDFASAKEMATYLQELVSNRSAYMKYFAWKSLGWSRPWQKPPYSFSYCKLCERLYGNFSPSSVESVEKWYYETSQCEGHTFADSWPEGQ